MTEIVMKTADLIKKIAQKMDDKEAAYQQGVAEYVPKAIEACRKRIEELTAAADEMERTGGIPKDFDAFWKTECGVLRPIRSCKLDMVLEYYQNHIDDEIKISQEDYDDIFLYS